MPICVGGRVARGDEPVELEHDLTRGGDRVRAVVAAVRQRRAEDGEEPVAEKLVHDAVVLVDGRAP